MLTTSNIMLVLAVVATGLLAGLFYAYSCSVNPGLGALSDANYLSAMQSINRAIQNPAFLASFMGALIVLPIATFQHLGTARFAWLLAATIIYAIGPIGLTFAGNIPLNNALDVFNMKSASAADMAQFRAKFEGPWNRLHAIRTWASVLAFVLAVIACLKQGKVTG